MSSDKVSELRIIADGCTLFDDGCRYVIPLYQRAFAWGEKEIIQLIEDINDIDNSGNNANRYCLGSLIVSEKENRENVFEVVDGQQRLTTLYLLLNYLKLTEKASNCALTFECRLKSNYTLENIRHFVDIIRENDGKNFTVKDEQIEQNLYAGLRTINAKMRELRTENGDFDNSFADKLHRVIIYRIKVPKHTDLNHYFEIMNVRGEQLEQHDVLKARLMEYLPQEERVPFAEIWEACSDMSGYVQMHLLPPVIREKLFGKLWNEPITTSFDLKSVNNEESSEKKSIDEIIDPTFSSENVGGEKDGNERVRFESIIDFPYFLLHALKVFEKNYCQSERSILYGQLDDKRLTEEFDALTKNGVLLNVGKIKDNKEAFSRLFIVHLLRCRFLFDKYIVKREFVKEDTIGVWSLKSLYVSWGKSQKQRAQTAKPYYANTEFTSKGERKQNEKQEVRHKENLMIQACLRVSYTSPKVMHWITHLLDWLTANFDNIDQHIAQYSNQAEEIARKAVRENYLQLDKSKRESLGVDTPHVVFNYLDYLLWRHDKVKYGDFVFEFRNSVEHWYPRNPSEGTFDKWVEDKDNPENNVNAFGNLCIVSSKVNSRFSNMAPEAKKVYGNLVTDGSIKLRIMSSETVEENGKSASQRWKEGVCARHGKEMLDILTKYCINQTE